MAAREHAERRHTAPGNHSPHRIETRCQTASRCGAAWLAPLAPLCPTLLDHSSAGLRHAGRPQNPFAPPRCRPRPSWPAATTWRYPASRPAGSINAATCAPGRRRRCRPAAMPPRGKSGSASPANGRTLPAHRGRCPTGWWPTRRSWRSWKRGSFRSPAPTRKQQPSYGPPYGLGCKPRTRWLVPRTEPAPGPGAGCGGAGNHSAAHRQPRAEARDGFHRAPAPQLSSPTPAPRPGTARVGLRRVSAPPRGRPGPAQAHRPVGQAEKPPPVRPHRGLWAKRTVSPRRQGSTASR